MKVVKYDPKVHPDNVTHDIVFRVKGHPRCRHCERTRFELVREAGDPFIQNYVCPVALEIATKA